MTSALIMIASISVVTYIVVTIMIYDYLRKAGEKVSFLWMRIFMIKNAGRYKKLTKEKTGETGPLFYWWVISINLAFVCVIILFSGFKGF